MTSTAMERRDGLGEIRATTRHENDGAHSKMTITGRAVPYDEPTLIGFQTEETIAPGALRAPDDSMTGVKACWRHNEPIGRVTTLEDREDGLYFTMTLSDTAQGRDAYTLAKDGVIDRVSIGFEPVTQEITEDPATGAVSVRRTDAILREISLVPFPAYEGATITNVRAADTTTKNGEPVTTTAPAPEAPDTLTRADLDAFEQRMTDLIPAAPAAPAQDTRSAGEFIKALVAGDAETRDLYARAFDGAKTSDDGSMKPAFIGDLTRLFAAMDNLAPLFQTGALPNEGMSIEFSELSANTVSVTEQAVEGADLTKGKVTIKDRTAPVKTWGGYTSLSVQAIERTRAPMLNHHLNAMALAAGKASAENFTNEFATAVKGQDANKITIAKAPNALTWADLSGMVIDAAAKFSDLALTLDGLIVNKATFKALAGLTGTDGRPLMTVTGTGTNTVGNVAPLNLSGDVAGLKITPAIRLESNALGTGIYGAFYSTLAMRQYESPLVQLQDQNVLNLTHAFSVYRYSAVAAEIPGGLVPVKFGA